MLKYWKHLTAAFVACLVLVLLAQPAEAAGGQYGAFTYELKGNGTAVITRFDWDKHPEGEDVYVPRMIEGYTVTTIGTYAFTGKNASGIAWDSIHNGCIENGRFGQEVAIVLPDTITVISEKAFFWTKITACDIPASVQLIGPGAFAGCYNISKFSVNSGNKTYATIDGVLFNKAKKELVAFPLSYAKDEYSIPQGILSIGDYAFYALGRNPTWNVNSHIYLQRVSQVRVSISDTVTTLGDYAFYGATNISGGLPVSVLYIGDYAFAHADLSLSKKNMPAPLSIGANAFAYCNTHAGSSKYKSYNSIYISLDNLTFIGEGAFRETMSHDNGLVGFEKASITHIPANLFRSSNVAVEVLPAGVTTIGAYAYYDTKINMRIHSKVVTIENNAFASARGSITFADYSHLTTIEDEAFMYFIYSESTELTLPSSVVSIGSRAFKSWEGRSGQITVLSIPESVTEIGDDVVDRVYTVLRVTPGSYADIWASENGVPTETDDTSWLFE